MTEETGEPKARARRLAVLGAPALAAVLAYLPNLDDFYVSDDFDHPFVHGYSFAELWAHLTRPAASGDFFRPLTRVSMGLDHLLWGAAPEPSHVVNVLIHAATAVLVGALGRRLSGRVSAGLLAGVLFALHPIHPEAVSFLGARFDLLAGFFAAASLLSYVRFAEGGAARWLALSTACFVASIGSKEAGLFVPLALLAYELLCAERRTLWRPLPSFAVLALYGVHRVFVIGTTGGYQTGLGASRHLPALDLHYFENYFGFASYGLITPVNQPAVEAMATPLVLLLAVMFVALLAHAAVVRTARWKALLFCAITTGVAALPASSLYSAASLPGGLEGARFLYAPSVAFAVLLGMLLDEVKPAAIRGAAMGVQVALFGALCLAHSLVWSHAADLSRGVIETAVQECGELRGPEPTVAIYDAPDNYLGAFVLRNGIPLAIEHFHPDHPLGLFFRRALESDFVPEVAFDVRDLVGREDVCVLVWDPLEERAVNRTETLRAAPARSFADRPAPRGHGPRWWADWTLLEAETLDDAEAETWALQVDGEDPQISAMVPLDVRAVRIRMTVSPPVEIAGASAEAFWAVDDARFSSPEGHHIFFTLAADGRPHDYEVPLPLGDPDDLHGEQIRLRIDPTRFEARVDIERIELVRPEVLRE